MIDLRSDTVTKPTPGMRAAIAEAEVGDEQRGEDPTVNHLLERVRTLLGKQAALFLPGGTMCNHIAIASHTRPGDAVLAHRSSHILRSESAGAVVLAGVQTEALDGEDGRFTAAQVEQAATSGSLYEPATTLVCVEQTHNFAGGTIWPLQQLAEVSQVAHAHGLAVHMDGARLLNAAVATGVPAREFAAHADSVWICFTKGLGAPIGAVLAGTQDFITTAQALKHIVGGALRQAGIAAAGCLYALDHHVQRLAQDHALASRLADGLKQLPAVGLLTPHPDTNMVFFQLHADGWTHTAFLERLAARGVLIGPVGRHLRAVTHMDVTAADIDRALQVIQEILAAPPPTPSATAGTDREQSRRGGVVPVIQCDIRQGRSPEQKQALARALTRVVHDTIQAPIEHIYVLIRGSPGDHHVHAGEPPARMDRARPELNGVRLSATTNAGVPAPPGRLSQQS